MKCKFCGKEMTPDIITRAEIWGIIKEAQCPKCNMSLWIKLEGTKSGKREFQQIGEILKEIREGSFKGNPVNELARKVKKQKEDYRNKNY